MRGVADAEEPGPPPISQPIDRDGEQLDVVPAFQFVDPVGRNGDISTIRSRNARGPPNSRLDPALRDDVGALPVVAAIEHHHDPARIEVAESVALSLLLRDRRNQSTSIGAP